FTYTVNDNRFEVVNSQLKLKDGESLDFETENSINLEITATDDGNPNQSFIKNFAVAVTNVNEAPTEITLSNSSVAENNTAAIIGNLTVTDVDSTNFTYTVNDNRFEVVNSQLKLKDGESLDFETENSINLEITATDDGNPNQSFIKNFAVAVTNLNEAPTEITLSNSSVAENNTAAIIGDLTVTDVDSSNFTYTVNDNRFEVVNSQLKLKDGESLDFESENSITLEITATDDGNPNQSFTSNFALAVTNVNEAPTEITLSNSSVAENNTAAVIGDLTVTDVDSSNFTYTVNDNRFEVVNSQLKLKDGESLDFESENSINLEVTATDDGNPNQSFTKSLTIAVTNINEAPTDIALSNTSVAENDTPAIIGNLTVTDVDSTNFTYSVSDNRFEVVNSQLKLKDGESLDFETENSIALEITATDDGNPNQSFTKSLTIAVTNVNEAPTAEDATFTVDENSTSGTEVGIITATDPENEALNFAIANGNIDPDGDSNLAFAIDSSTGTITVNDFDDLDFEVIPTFNLEVTATDVDSLTNTADITVNLNDVAPAVFDTESNNRIFALNGGDSTNVKFTLANNNTENVNEVGVFVVDDENGSVDGNAPGSDGYLQAALQRSQVILSAVSDRPSGFDLGDIERVLEVDSDARLSFYLVSNGTTDTALAELESTGTTNLPIFFSDSDNLQVSDLGTEGFNLNWSDEVGGTDFTNLNLSVQLTQDAPAPATELQGNPQNELIDLSNQTGQVSVSVEVHREAAFDNLIGFYQVVDANGGIDIDGDGIADFNPGDAGYEEAALTNRITGLDLLQTDNQQTTTFDGTFDGGSILASFMVVDGTVDEAINNNAEVYFSFLGANSDGVDHIRLLGDNTFGYEDLAGGGDFDYNDMIVKVNPTV
ncbi:MAG: cadherin domain-containing protein, partial [Cyanobacteria bacterium J06629_18]